MKRILLQTALLMLVCWIAGCATTVPQRATPPQKDSAIVEEDIKDEPRDGATQAPGPPTPGVSAPSGLPTEQPPPLTGPADRAPRRFIWKDQKGSGRSWAPAEE